MFSWYLLDILFHYEMVYLSPPIHVSQLGSVLNCYTCVVLVITSLCDYRLLCFLCSLPDPLTSYRLQFYVSPVQLSLRTLWIFVLRSIACIVVLLVGSPLLKMKVYLLFYTRLPPVHVCVGFSFELPVTKLAFAPGLCVPTIPTSNRYEI